MEKPKIVAITEKKTPDGRPATLPTPQAEQKTQPAAEQPSQPQLPTPPQPTAAKPAAATVKNEQGTQQSNNTPEAPAKTEEITTPQPPDASAPEPAVKEITDLERSILDEVHRRGEALEAELEGQKEREADEDAAELAKAIEVTSDAATPRPRIIKRVVPEDLHAAARRQAAQDVTPMAVGPAGREMTLQERDEVTQRALKLHEERKAGESVFTRLKKIVHL